MKIVFAVAGKRFFFTFEWKINQSDWGCHTIELVFGTCIDRRMHALIYIYVCAL